MGSTIAKVMNVSSQPNSRLWNLMASLNATKMPLATVNAMKSAKSAGPRFCAGFELRGGEVAVAMLASFGNNYSIHPL